MYRTAHFTFVLFVLTPFANLAASTTSLLKHIGTNRYFTDPSGNPVYLAGSHYWQNLQDYGPSTPPQPLDFERYLDFMQMHGHNFMRLWAWESAWQAPWVAGNFYFTPLPFARSATCCAAGGGNKFDLNKFNQAYFDRLRQRVIEAGNRGIYVSVMLFNGWSTWDRNLQGNPYLGHPFRSVNNINGANGDPLGLNEGYLMHTLDRRLSSKIHARQKAYVRKVVDTLGDLDNVLYEIANESDSDHTLQNQTAGMSSKDWQYDMIRYIKRYEARKPKQHSVGMSAGPGLSGAKANTILFGSPADWVAPTGYDSTVSAYKTDPAVTDGSKVVIADTDHIFGEGGDQVWVWKTFMRGNNIACMDSYTDADRHGLSDKDLEDARVAMGQTVNYARRMSLLAATPHGELASTNYSLVNPGSEYLVFQPLSGPFTVDLSAATTRLAVEWFNPTTGTAVEAPAVDRYTVTFTPPFSGPAVLYLKAVVDP